MTYAPNSPLSNLERGLGERQRNYKPKQMYFSKNSEISSVALLLQFETSRTVFLGVPSVTSVFQVETAG
jgi:hypothetical protein